jgi:hypothetical protein
MQTTQEPITAACPSEAAEHASPRTITDALTRVDAIFGRLATLLAEAKELNRRLQVKLDQMGGATLD